jgi:hypothetical protein
VKQSETTDNVVPISMRRRARDQLTTLLASGDKPLPLTILLENMWFWYSQAERLASSTDPSNEPLARIARSQSQRCAVEAAPFVHARLQSTTVSGDDDQPLRVEHSVRVRPEDLRGKSLKDLTDMYLALTMNDQERLADVVERLHPPVALVASDEEG